MKLYLSATSPFSRLCAITALRVGREDTQLQFVDPWANPLALEQVNPFSQVPTLLTDDGLYLTNTLIICQHIDNRIWHGSRAAQKSGYAFSLMEQFVKYFSLIHKTDGVAQPVPHPHIERSLHALKRALPNAPALDPTSEDWEQYLLAVTLLFIAPRRCIAIMLAQTISSPWANLPKNPSCRRPMCPYWANNLRHWQTACTRFKKRFFSGKQMPPKSEKIAWTLLKHCLNTVACIKWLEQKTQTNSVWVFQFIPCSQLPISNSLQITDFSLDWNNTSSIT